MINEPFIKFVYWLRGYLDAHLKDYPLDFLTIINTKLNDLLHPYKPETKKTMSNDNVVAINETAEKEKEEADKKRQELLMTIKDSSHFIFYLDEKDKQFKLVINKLTLNDCILQLELVKHQLIDIVQKQEQTPPPAEAA